DLQTADGDSIPVEARFSHYLYEGHTEARTGVVRDVTERKQHEETLTTLYETAQELLGSHTKEDVAEMIVETVTKVLDIAGVAVYCYDETKDLLVPVAQSSGPKFIGEYLKPWAPGDSSVHGHVFAAGETKRYDDVTDSPYLQNEDTSMRSGIFVPVGEYGVFSVGAEHVGAFDQQTEQLLEMLGANAEVALDRVEGELALEESERRYRTLIEYFPNGAVALVDRDLRYLAIGGELFFDVDGPVSDLGGQTIYDHLPDEVLETFEREYRATFDGQRREFKVTFDDRIAYLRTVPITEDDGEVSTIIAMSQEVTERVERERELERQREQLSALNSLNAIVRDITEAVIEQSTREEIEEIVCERLAASDSYLFAWFGEVDPRTHSFKPKVEAGTEGYLEEISLSVNLDDPTGRGPAGMAVQTREMQVSQNVFEDPDFEPWHEAAEKYGYRSVAAIPVTHEDVIYGVLGVYTERKWGFTDDERSVVDQLGEIVGHAIAAVERKRALMSDEVVELEFQVRDVDEACGLSEETNGMVDFERAVPIGDGNFIEYGTTTGNGLEIVEELIGSDTHPHWESITVIETEGEITRFELRSSDPPILSMVASHGGYVNRARFEDGDFTIQIHLPPGADVHQVVDTVKTTYPSIRFLTQRQVTRDPRSSARLRGVLFEELTDRQRAAIEAAYYAGFFEWPRDTTGEMVAESMGVSASTFHQHLRKGQLKLFATLFEAETTDEAST
ncbi:MAG: bacterio-opsin activator domain-containing protein, partial [Halodesulfurarchaeum sp.]